MHAYTGKHQKSFWILIRRCVVHVLSVIRITVLDLEPNPCFLIFLNISKTTHQIVNCKIKHVIPCCKEHDTSFIWYYYAYDISKCHSGSGSGFVSKFSLLCNFVNFAHRNMYDASKESCAQGLHFFFLHLRALSYLWGRYGPKTEKSFRFCL